MSKMTCNVLDCVKNILLIIALVIPMNFAKKTSKTNGGGSNSSKTGAKAPLKGTGNGSSGASLQQSRGTAALHVSTSCVQMDYT